MTRDAEWLLREKYQGEKTEVSELLKDFIAFQSRTKFEKKTRKTSEVNTHSLSESELLFAEFCATTMQNEKMGIFMQTHGEIVKRFLADCKRLGAGEPLAYVIGWVPFLNAKIFLDSHPLIPRPETEYWVEQAIQEIKSSESQRVLDLCAGSGCIGIAVLKAVPNASVDFAEIDTAHHATITRNLRENEIDPLRARIFGGDLFEQITGTYDCILANPPYIDPEADRTEESVRTHEPHRALYGGQRGLEIIERIVNESPQFLTERGTLYIEHEPEHADFVGTLAQKHGFTPVGGKDQYGIFRYTRLTKREE